MQILIKYYKNNPNEQTTQITHSIIRPIHSLKVVKLLPNKSTLEACGWHGYLHARKAWIDNQGAARAHQGSKGIDFIGGQVFTNRTKPALI